MDDGGDWALPIFRARLSGELASETAMFLAVVQALEQRGDAAAADAILAETARRPPEDALAWDAWADAAYRRRDIAEAARRWEQVRQLFPHETRGPVRLLRQLRDSVLDEAEALAQVAMQLDPTDPAVLGEAAKIATRRGDRAEALRRASAFVRAAPQLGTAHIGFARALRDNGQADEADAALAAAVGRFPADFGVAHEWADAAFRRHDLPEALRRFDEVRARFPQVPAGILAAARMRRDLRRLDEAEARDREAAAQFPDDFGIVGDWADLAVRRRAWDDAQHRWTEVAARFPDNAAGLLGQARVLRETGRTREALALYTEATGRFPTEPQGWIGWAEWAEDLESPEEAMRRWETVRARFPYRWEGFAMAAGLLRRRLRTDEADALLAEARRRFPDEQAVLFRSALAAEARADWAEAAQFYTACVARFRASAMVYAGLVRAQARIGQYEQAVATLEQARKQSPRDHDLRLVAIELALDSNNLPQATEKWRELHAEAGDGLHIHSRLHRLRWRLLDFGIDPEAGLVAAAPTEWATNEIVQQFESLGGVREGCEFGIFQRAHGVEPLGLLRWSSMNPQDVIDGLAADFAGVGSPEQTRLDSGLGDEYVTRDTRYGMPTDTFVKIDEVTPEVMLRRATTRLRFLRDKFLQDLKSAEKVFLYKFSAGPLPDETIEAMHAALSRHGPCTLLAVRLADAADPFPSVRWLRPRLMVGHMDRFSYLPDGTQSTRAHDLWEAVIRHAFALWRSAPAT